MAFRWRLIQINDIRGPSWGRLEHSVLSFKKYRDKYFRQTNYVSVRGGTSALRFGPSKGPAGPLQGSCRVTRPGTEMAL